MNYEGKIDFCKFRIDMSINEKPLLFPLAPCPWCRITARFNINYTPNSGGTWLWDVTCACSDCHVKPRGKSVAIRKDQRFNVFSQIGKLRYLAQEWNIDAPIKIREQIQIKESDMWLQIIEYIKDMRKNERDGNKREM